MADPSPTDISQDSVAPPMATTLPDAGSASSSSGPTAPRSGGEGYQSARMSLSEGKNRKRKSEGEDEERARELSAENEPNHTIVVDPQILVPSCLARGSYEYVTSSGMQPDGRCSSHGVCFDELGGGWRCWRRFDE